ncbi:MAG: ABC transporter ATP-binding protein [Bacteroidales bacterium]|nr:ABC transporter ATP-binding protein [Bacteroidales bacterium]
MINEESVVEVKNVFKSFKTVKAVNGANLQIKNGKFIAILGPNGAGKTTLVEIIEGIQKPDKGEVFILGKKWKGNENELHRFIGLSLQDTYFIDKLRVWETLMLFASFYDIGKKRIDEIIELMGLEEKRKSYVVNLSGGQRQKLSLGIALLNNPKILILDEPTTGLDPNARREIWSILLKLKEKSQTSLILTTHYMDEAEKLCDYIIIMNNGNVIKEGATTQLLNEDHGDKLMEFTFENFIDDIDSSDLPLSLNWDVANQKGFVKLNKVENDLTVFMNFIKEKGFKLKTLECRRKTLDDIFITLTGKHLNE